MQTSVLIATIESEEYALLVTTNPYTGESIMSKEDFERLDWTNTFRRDGERLRWDKPELLKPVPYREGTFAELVRAWGGVPAGFTATVCAYAGHHKDSESGRSWPVFRDVLWDGECFRWAEGPAINTQLAEVNTVFASPQDGYAFYAARDNGFDAGSTCVKSEMSIGARRTRR